MVKRKKKLAVVCCNGDSSLKKEINKDTLSGGCAQIAADHSGGSYECGYGCLGGGDCVSVCRLKAISINKKNNAQVDREKCVGCGLCVKVCPQNIIRLITPGNTITPLCANREAGAAARKVCSVSCIACHICERNCPCDAISVVDNHAVIDQGRCVACGMCAVKCPRGVIVDADGIFTVIQ